EVVFQALSKKPEERFATAAVMAKALMAALPVGSQPTQETRPPSASPSGAIPLAPAASAADPDLLESANTMLKPGRPAPAAAPASSPAETPQAPATATSPLPSPVPNPDQPAAPAPARAAEEVQSDMSTNPAPVMKKSNTGLIIGIVVGVLLLLVAGTAVGGWFVLKKFRGADGPLG
ncbi:MAG TPA: hypothetical protein DFS52_14835, partial [Myxococcales bacterium]|nr:hypothetical protein [Myxococcales bacterium]